MDKHINIDKELVDLVGNELGQKTADLFTDLYDGFPLDEQVAGAREVLYEIVGVERTNDLLKKIENKK